MTNIFTTLVTIALISVTGGAFADEVKTSKDDTQIIWDQPGSD